jgi:hypothetical protein
MRIREVMIVLLSLSIAGFGKNDEKEDELPPLPTWDPVDEKLVQQGEIVPGMDLFRTDTGDVELPVPPPVTPDPELLTPAAAPEPEEDLPTRIASKFHDAYFARRPASYLMDPQELLSRQEFRDRENFLDYHAGDSEINLYIYLFDEEQELPEGRHIREVLESRFGGNGPTALVFYYLGMPERTEMEFSEDIRSAVAVEERVGALRTSIEESLEKSEESDQLDNFSAELSIRLYWFEKGMSGPIVMPVSSAGALINPDLLGNTPVAVSKGVGLGSMTHLVWGIALLVLAAGLGWVGRILAQRRVHYLFPEVESDALLGAPHAAGVGAVISFRSAEVPPSQQRDQVPDYLQRM